MYDGSIYCCCSYGSAAGMQPTVRSVGCIIDPAAACLQTAVAAGMAVMICCYLLQPISYYSSLLLPLLVLLAANSSAYRQHPLPCCCLPSDCSSSVYGGYDLPLPTKVRCNSYYGILLLYPLILLLAANCSASPYPAAACLQSMHGGHDLLLPTAAYQVYYYCWQPTVQPIDSSIPDPAAACLQTAVTE
jgi:hypothetical protein